MDRDETMFMHKVFQNDPLLFQSYVAKEVSVTTEDGKIHIGVVYTVDPVSESVVLLDLEDKNDVRMKIILGHAIKNITVVSETEHRIPEILPVKSVSLSPTAISDRKSALMKLLKENRFSVTDVEGVLKVEDIVSVEPPYRPDNCICTNGIILSRVQKIVARLDD